MSSEVFAEDIEALLERLEGVSSARVIATDAGDIDAIHVTATADQDESAVRRTIASALMSRYSLAVDGWRIRVARLRTPGPAPSWRAHRVEEALAGSAVRVTVALVAAEAGGPPLTGHARSLPDRANRLRGVALATLDALKSVLESEGRRATLDSLTSVPLVGREAIVVAVQLATATDARLVVGAATIDDGEADAVINATLNALEKREATPQRGWTMKDRQNELESMRAHYRRLREPQRQMPSLTPEANGGDGVPDTTDLAAIRPERAGGAAPGPGAGERPRPQEPGQVRMPAKGGMEDEYFRHLVTAGLPVHIRCRDGYEIPDAVVKDFGTYSLLVESEAGRELVFKHGILSIRPLRAANHLKG